MRYNVRVMPEMPIPEPTSSDHDLVALVHEAKDGDKNAFGKLFTIFYAPVYRYVFYRVGARDEADEITQEVFLKAYKAFSGYDPARAPSPLSYFYTIARHVIIDRKRKDRTIIIEPEQWAMVPDNLSSSPEDDAVRSEEGKVLYAALWELSGDMREAIVLRFMGGLAGREVAHVMGKSEESVRALQSRGIRILRTKLDNLWKH